MEENIDPTLNCPNPNCNTSIAEGQIKILGRPTRLRTSLNEVWQCIKCRYIFSPKQE